MKGVTKQSVLNLMSSLFSRPSLILKLCMNMRVCLEDFAMLSISNASVIFYTKNELNLIAKILRFAEKFEF